MDIQRLRYFITVAQMEHMSKAAQKLHITQPALSKAIAILEEELGGPLFSRVGRRIELNAHGKAFFQYAEQALNTLDNGVRSIKALNDPHQSRIRFQTNIIGDYYLIDLVTGFKRENPNARFEIITTYSKSKYFIDCDCYITSARIPLYQCTSIPIFSEVIKLAVPASHPLATQGSVALKEAAGEAFVGITKTQSWAEEVGEFCTEAGFKPNIVYVCDYPATLFKLIAAGEGVGFAPAQSHAPYPEGLVLLDIAHPKCTRQYKLSWQTNKALSPQAASFIEYVKTYFSQITQ